MLDPAPLLSLTVAARTDAGLHRAANEDSFLAEFPVFVVADGMGGHDAGDRASAAVIDAFRPLVGRVDVQPADVADAVARAHAAVVQIADGTVRGAGSTLTGVVHILHDERPFWLVVNIGDSRVYRLRDGAFERMTIDHSLMQEQLDSGELAPEDAQFFVHRNVITRAVGAPDSPADYWVRPVSAGERLLVCSDGLTGEVDEQLVYEVLSSDAPADARADALVRGALANGGHDNVTVLVIDVPVVDAAAEDVDAATLPVPVAHRV